jgi:hypothetical protein
MSYPVALILAVEQSVDPAAALPAGALDEPGVLAINRQRGSARFFYKRVPGTFTAAGSTWKLFIVQPDGDITRAAGRALKERIAGLDQAKVRSFTPGGFAAIAPVEAVQAVKDTWFTVWRAESSAEGIAAQQSYGDADLEEP